MGSNFGSLDTSKAIRSPKLRMIGYGTFLWDAIKDIAAGKPPKAWGEKIRVLNTIKVEGYRRLWPGSPNYPVIQKAEGFFFFGILFEIDETQLARFDQIEGAPTLYTREIVNVQFRGRAVPAFIYIPTENLLQHVIREYERAGREPGVDDWGDYLRRVLSPEELQVFPELF